MPPLIKTSRILVFLAAAAVLGCGQRDPAGPPPKTINYELHLPEALSHLTRVAMVELSSAYDDQQTASDTTEALAEAIASRNLFEVKVIHKDDPVWERIPRPGENKPSLADLRDMRQAFRCDAIVIGSIRNFQPPPRMQMRVRLRMLDLRDANMIWSVDQLWDSTDEPTARRMEEYFEDQQREGMEPLEWRLALISPLTFEKFVAHEVARTLPPGEGVEDKVRSPASRALKKTGKKVATELKDW